MMNGRNPMRVMCLLMACGMVVVACDDGREPASPRGASAQEITRCDAQTLESDLDAAPFVGPAADEATSTLRLEPGATYIVSSTYGVPKPGASGGPTERYLGLFGAIEAQLQQEPGLLALQLASSDACRSGRTLAVWRSEEEMLHFVTSPAHLDAMRAASEVLEPGYEVTHWTIEGGDAVDFRAAVARLGREIGTGP
ncbi:MAG: antibiotic biosynthesis monooxygenase [Polyangiales bacterium]